MLSIANRGAGGNTRSIAATATYGECVDHIAVDPCSKRSDRPAVVARPYAGARALVQDHPHNPEARDALAHTLAALDRLSEAIAEERRALADDPASPALRTALGFFLRAFGAIDEAAGVLEDAVSLHPDWTIARLELGRARLAQGMPELAAAEIARVEPEWGRFQEALAAGRRHDVERRLDEWIADARAAPYWLAERCMWAGDDDRALAQLERAHAEHQLRVVYAGVDPVFAPLRGSGRFQRLLAGTGVGASPS